MKRFLIILSAITFTFGLTACSAEKDAEPEKKETEEAAKDPAVNPKSVLFKFYMSVVKGINEADADLNAYEGAEEPKPEEKAAASASAAEVAERVKEIEIPEELKEQKADLKTALEEIAKSYEIKAEELQKDAPSMEAADEAFANGEAKFGDAFESLGMKRPVMGKEL